MLGLIQQNIKNKLSIGMLILIILSWALYPWAISWIYPTMVRLAFASGLVLIIAWLYFDKGKSKEKSLDGWEKLLFAIWGAYILCAAIATFAFNDGNPDLFLRYVLKSLFFLVLFFYLNKQTIFLSFDIYANLCVALVVLSMAAILGLSLGWMDVSVANVTRGVDYQTDIGLVFSGFDGNNRVFPWTARYMRMQSYSIEPGTFSLAILPALYWFVLVRRQLARATVIVLGIAASWSLGAFVTMILAIIILYKNKMVVKSNKLFLLFGAVFFVVSHVVFTNVVSPSVVSPSVVSPSVVSPGGVNSAAINKPNAGIPDVVAGDRTISKQQRVDELKQVIDYMSANFWGAGVGAARAVLHSSISVGYANVFAETGLLGGSLYLIVFLLLGYEAAKGVLGKFGNSTNILVDHSVVALGLSVLTCLFFGLQREQPDASYWHMWIYASFFSLYGIARQGNAKINE